MYWEMRLKDLEKLRKLYDLIKENHGSNIVILELEEFASFTDFFVISTATSEPHLKQLKEDIRFKFKESSQELPFGIEGEPHSGWVILDYNDIVIHFFNEEKRDYYNLERIWGQCKRIEFED